MNPIFKNAQTEHQLRVLKKIALNMLDANRLLQWIAIGLLSTIPFYFGLEADNETF
jgi:hypothetical protein